MRRNRKVIYSSEEESSDNENNLSDGGRNSEMRNYESQWETSYRPDDNNNSVYNTIDGTGNRTVPNEHRVSTAEEMESGYMYRVPQNYSRTYDQNVDLNSPNGINTNRYFINNPYKSYRSQPWNYDQHSEYENGRLNINAPQNLYFPENYLHNESIDSTKYPPYNSFNSPQVNYYENHPQNPINLKKESLETPKRKSIPPRTKINLKYIQGKNKRNVTFSKRKKGIMKKAFELATLTGSDILLLVASESGHVYTYATPKLKGFMESNQEVLRECLSKQEDIDSFDNENS